MVTANRPCGRRRGGERGAGSGRRVDGWPSEGAFASAGGLGGFPDHLHRRFKLLCATRGLSIRAEVIRLIEQELAKVDDIEAALRAVLGPAPERRRRPPAH